MDNYLTLNLLQMGLGIFYFATAEIIDTSVRIQLPFSRIRPFKPSHKQEFMFPLFSLPFTQLTARTSEYDLTVNQHTRRLILSSISNGDL